MGVAAIDILSLCLAALFGGIIGLEREISAKPVGLRTNILICLGAAIFTVVSREMAASFGGSATRMAAHVVGGVGFLGAGAIIRDRGTVQGATTAATIWLVASIGVACGARHLLLASVGTLLTLFTLLGLAPLERRIERQRCRPQEEESSS